MTKRNLLITFLVLIVVLNLIRALLPISHLYLKRSYWDRFPSLRKTFYDSIYKNKKGEFIRDEYVYAYAAGAYLQGTSPILENPETPPLGKYLIGLSIVFFNNENIVTLIFGIGSLILLYILGKQIFSSSLIALLPVLLLSFEPLYLNQFRYTPLLDIMQLFFLLSFFVVFNRAEVSKKYIRYFLLANCMLGAFIAIKFFGTGVTLVAGALLVLLLRKETKKIVMYCSTLFIAPLILLLMYLPVLFTGYSVTSFLGIQKWILLYNIGHTASPFTFFPLFLANIWYSWWDTSVMSDAQWRITWPLSFLALLTVLWMYLKSPKIRSRNLDIVLAWVVMYIAMLQFGYVSARYFVILLPPMFIIMVYAIRESILLFKKEKS